MVPIGILASVLAVTALAAPAPAVDNLSGPFSLPLKRSVISTATRRDGVDIPLTVFGKEKYYSITISVGTPPQEVTVLLDTGSSALWIADDGHHFDNSHSSTFHYAFYGNGDKVPWNFSYMKGFAKGYLAQDTVAVGPFKQDTLLNSAYESHQLPGNNSGVIGFGWPQPDIPEPLWYIAAKQWKDKRFGIYFGRADEHVQTVNDASLGGLLTLGGVEESLFTGNINYLPLLKGYQDRIGFDFQWRWVVPTDAVKINGKLVDVGPSYPAMADTGTTLIMGNKAHVAKLYELVPGAMRDDNASGQDGGTVQAYAFPCDADFELSFEFAGETYPIKSRDLIHGRRWDGACYGAVVGSDIDFWMLGDYFLKHVYTIHRVDPPGLAFAKLK